MALFLADTFQTAPRRQIYSVTFRLYDCLPASLLQQMKEETKEKDERAAMLRRIRLIEEHLDKSTGYAFLSKAEAAAITEEALLFPSRRSKCLASLRHLPGHPWPAYRAP